jgi:hypothetical protein
MRAACDISPIAFMAVNLAVVNEGVLAPVLAWHPAARLAKLVPRAAVALCAVIVTWHLTFVAHLLTG